MKTLLFPWKLVSFRTKADTKVLVGLLRGEEVVDLTAAFVASGKNAPEGMRQVLEWHSREDLTEWFEQEAGQAKVVYPVQDLLILPIITNPRMFYDFLGFEQHVRQIRAKRGVAVAKEWYKRPAYYVGSVSPDKLFGNGREVVIPRFVEKPDYEAEFALVIGREGKLTTLEEAADFIKNNCFFTLFNDWSARDYQAYDQVMGLGVSHSKTIIGSSLGPSLVHASNFVFNREGDPDIPIKLIFNGKVRCESNTNTAYWGFAKILTFLGSENLTLFPGDVLGSGTVGNGSIAEFGPKIVEGKEVEPATYPWLQGGDEVTLETEKIGRLTNRVSFR